MIDVPVNLDNWLTVRTRAEPSRIPAGGHGTLEVEVQIPDGCHIEAHQPAEPFLIPTALHLGPAEGLDIGSVRYPVPGERRFDWSPVVLQVYSGTVRLQADIRVAPSAQPGARTIHGKLGYQGCTPNACLPPNAQALDIVVDVATEPQGSAEPSPIPNADVVLDAPGAACVTLTPLIKTRIRELEGGQVLEVRSDDRAAREGVPAWCRLTGNELLATLEDDTDRTRFYIRKQ